MYDQIKKNISLEEIPGKTFFVGDIHGQYALLMQQLDDLSFNFSCDRLIATGDIIDRGPEVVSCIGLLNQPWFYSVLGNHELAFLQAIADPMLRNLHVGIGGEWSYDHSDEVLALMAGLIKNQMPLTIQLVSKDASIGVVHAASLEDWCTTINCDEDQVDFITWDFNAAHKAEKGLHIATIKGCDLVISGHYCVSEPVL